MINVNSGQGRIGPFWWINSHPSRIQRIPIAGYPDDVQAEMVLWGSCGFGSRVRLRLEQINADEIVAMEAEVKS